ncbi:hypothetical protein EHQ53_14175 [Leptospira langatensis]|uniref:Uncharacterized protein n=1 Tax=Leptospira langatensis TaxID=2484983 RepID=A0ABY2MB28_9LEPT|nr:hypothetical protein [Leptospira langatensis]TGL39665.1 hypothetical protein EHQ53_14175 [Leptospira langatensis]
MKKRVIQSLHSEFSGWIYSNEGELTEISKNGEMAAVPWFLFKPKDGGFEKEINGKYVTSIIYKTIDDGVPEEEVPF